MKQRHHEKITGDQRMKDGDEKTRWWEGEEMDIEKGRKYVHHYHQQKKVENRNGAAVLQHASKLNDQNIVDTSAVSKLTDRKNIDHTSTVAEELSSKRFLVQLWHGDNAGSENINKTNPLLNYNYHKFENPQESIVEVEEEEKNLSFAGQNNKDTNLPHRHNGAETVNEAIHTDGVWGEWVRSQ